MVTLKIILLLNAASCIFFGLIFAIMPSAVASFLSTDSVAPDLAILLIGLGLILNGFHLVWASSKPEPSRKLIQHFSSGDFVWVLATVLLIVFGVWIKTPHGIITSLLVSVVVGTLGVAQMLKCKEMEHC